MPRGKHLSPRERGRIAHLWYGGFGNMKQIAARMSLSAKTVSNVIKSLEPEPGVCPECGHPENDGQTN